MPRPLFAFFRAPCRRGCASAPCTRARPCGIRELTTDPRRAPANPVPYGPMRAFEALRRSASAAARAQCASRKAGQNAALHSRERTRRRAAGRDGAASACGQGCGRTTLGELRATAREPVGLRDVRGGPPVLLATLGGIAPSRPLPPGRWCRRGARSQRHSCVRELVPERKHPIPSKPNRSSHPVAHVPDAPHAGALPTYPAAGDEQMFSEMISSHAPATAV